MLRAIYAGYISVDCERTAMAKFRWPVSHKMAACPGGLCKAGKAKFCMYDNGDIEVVKLCSICSRRKKVVEGKILEGGERVKPKNEDIDPYFARRKEKAIRRKKGKGVLGKF